MSYVTPQAEYDVRARRISGTHSEKLEQIDAAIQELLDIKLLECAAEHPDVHFLAVPRPRSHAFAMTITILLLVAALILLLGVRVTRAQTPDWHAGGTFDVGYLHDSNDPANHLFRTRGTTPHVDELDVNMAAAYLRKIVSPASRWGVELTAQGGHDTDAFGFSPTAPHIDGADWLRRLGPTNVSYLAPAGRGLTIQGGIFSSLIGYDSLYAKDNFAYTRPWGADFTPYLMLGANVAYPVSDRLGIAGFVVNDYFHLAHPNDVSSVGGQVSYALTSRVSLKQTALYGPNQADTSIDRWRILSDTILERKAGRLTAALELQLASEGVAETEERASWVAAQVPIHVSLAAPWSVTFRPEFARDPSGRYTGVRQTVEAFTSTLEYRKAVRDLQAILRFEYRYDHSKGAEGGFYAGPANELTARQPLIVAALIVAFDRGWTMKL